MISCFLWNIAWYVLIVVFLNYHLSKCFTLNCHRALSKKFSFLIITVRFTLKKSTFLYNKAILCDSLDCIYISICTSPHQAGRECIRWFKFKNGYFLGSQGGITNLWVNKWVAITKSIYSVRSYIYLFNNSHD